MTEPAGEGDNAEHPREPVIRAMTFIVRTSRTETGRVVGVVEHARTGRKERFDGIEAIGLVITAFIRAAEGPG